MKSLQKILVCFVLILFIFGCGAGIKTVITSDPPGAIIYMGDAPDNMSYSGITPVTFWNTANKPYWKEWYYQIKKVGYEESELIFKPHGAIGADRYVHATLKPSGESIVYVKNSIFLSSKPSVLGEDLGLMDKGTALTVIDTKETWYKVKSPSLGMGWIQFVDVVEDATEIEKAEEKKVTGTKEETGQLESETKLDDEKLKSVVYIKIPGYVYTKPNFEGTELIFLDKGIKLTVLETKENWIKVQSEYFETGWIDSNRVVADAAEFEKPEQKKATDTKEKKEQLESQTKLEDENVKCVEIQRLSDELLSLMTTFPPVPHNLHWDSGTKAYHPPIKSHLRNFSKLNGISLKILRLMDELHTAGPEKQIPDCNVATHLTFCRKATVSFSGKGLIDREDAQIKYKMTAKAPAILLIDFTVMASPIEIIGYGFAIMSESPHITYPSTHVEFSGDLIWHGTPVKRYKATQFECNRGPVVTMAGVNMSTVTVDLPSVMFYSKKGTLKVAAAYPHDFQWSPIHLSEQDLQKAFEKGRLTLRRKTETKSLSGSVTIDFAPPDPELQAPGQSNPGGIGLWGDRTTHGGFLLATGKGVFSDEHPVAKEGDPVLCPIHGLSKVSRDESSGVYIGDKTVAFAEGKADCGAKIMSESTLMEVQPVKQYMNKPPKAKPIPLDKPPEARERPLYDDDKLPVPWDEPDEAKERPLEEPPQAKERPLYDDDKLPVPWDEPDEAKERPLEEPPQAKERPLEGQAKERPLYDDDKLPVPWDEPDEAKERPLDKPKGYDIAD